MPVEEHKPIFSFLHISDLHFRSESVKEDCFRESILKEIQDLHIIPNCVIVSGDVFNKGSLSIESSTRTTQYINRLRGNDNTPCYITPGNHDVDRLASKKDEDAYNKYQTRRDILRSKVEEMTRVPGEFQLNSNEKDILYSKAFGDFFRFLSVVKASPFCGIASDPGNQQGVTAANYEVGIHYYEIPHMNSRVRIVLINTALLAGQSINGIEYQNKLAELRKKVINELDLGHNVIAAKHNVELSRIQERFEKDGELVIDEEALSETNRGRMSLSREGLALLSGITNQDDNHCVLTLFVGHHGIDYLSDATKEALSIAMENCNSKIYLCGHAHKAGRIEYVLNNSTVHQFQAGGLFLDGTKYAQSSFNYGCVSLKEISNSVDGDKNFEVVVSISSHFQMETPSQKLMWYTETFSESTPQTYIIRKNETPLQNLTRDEMRNSREERQNNPDYSREPMPQNPAQNDERDTRTEQQTHIGSDKSHKKSLGASEAKPSKPAITGNVFENNK